jgi:EVE domain/Endonuclease NucS
MLEKDIENLIAQHPDEFFPGENFQLISQQYRIAGRIIDILFNDVLNRKIIVEIKRGILSREASGQIAEYFGLLKSQHPDDFHEMVLCANVIPKERRLFLEHIGIACKELGIGRISEIAKKYQYSFIDETPAPEKIEKAVSPQFNYEQTNQVLDDENISVWIFQANPQRYDILNALADNKIGNKKHWLVNQYKQKIRQGHLGLIWMSGKDAGIYAIVRIDSNPRIMGQYEPEKKYWIDASEASREALRVEISILKKLINNPVLKKDLVKVRQLENMSILKRFQGTNFPVTNREWQILSKFL